MPPREITLGELDKILTIPRQTSSKEEIETGVKDMVSFLLSISGNNQKPN